MIVKYFEIQDWRVIKCKGFIPEKGDITTVVLGVHGFAGDKESSMLTVLAEELVNKGGALFCLDFPSHGESDSKENELTVENCIRDLLTLAEWTEDFFPAQNRCVFATSFGGFVSLLAADKLKDYKMVLRAPAVTMSKSLLEKVLGITKEQFKNAGTVRCGFERKIDLPYSFYENISCYDLNKLNYKNPTLVFQGDKDDVVECGDVISFCNGRENVELIIMKNADHRFKKQGEIERIVDETMKFIENQGD
jgi:alpha/beta superfamily hydrolase